VATVARDQSSATIVQVVFQVVFARGWLFVTPRSG